MILGLPAWMGNSILQTIGDCSVVEGCGEATLAISRPSTCSKAGGYYGRDTLRQWQIYLRTR